MSRRAFDLTEPQRAVLEWMVAYPHVEVGWAGDGDWPHWTAAWASEEARQHMIGVMADLGDPSVDRTSKPRNFPRTGATPRVTRQTFAALRRRGYCPRRQVPARARRVVRDELLADQPRWHPSPEPDARRRPGRLGGICVIRLLLAALAGILTAILAHLVLGYLWPVRVDVEPARRMLDGSPCWCVSIDEPYAGWTHAPVCVALRNRARAFDEPGGGFGL